MELHENLYALGLRLGRDIFDDAEGFRGAVDDFLDEDAATMGDINLLVDAVRLGALRTLTSMLDSGADVGRAIEEAGNRLARDRSADVAGSRWACAVLGFAVGRVSDADVRRYRIQQAGQTMLPPHTPPQTPLPPPQTPLPPQPQVPPQSLTQPPPQPVTQPPPQPQHQPYPQPQLPPPGSPQTPPQSYPQPPGSAQTPPWQVPQSKKRKKWPLIVALVAVLALVGGGVAVVVAVTGDDDPGTPRTGSGSSTSTGDSTTPTGESTTPTGEGEPAPDPTSFDVVNQRYGALAGLVTTGMNDCTASTTPVAGEKERLECAFGGGKLTLTTFESGEQLMANRTRRVDLSVDGGRYLDDGAHVVYGLEEDDDPARTPSLYWDSSTGLQAALYEGVSGTTLDALVTTFKSTGPTVGWPTKPTDPELIEFLEAFVKVGQCDRIQTLTDDETEEVSCNARLGITVYFGKWTSVRALREYRRSTKNNRDLNTDTTWHYGDDTQPDEGALFDYATADGEDGVRYWDDLSCLCYGEAYLTVDSDLTTTLATLERWWAG